MSRVSALPTHRKWAKAESKPVRKEAGAWRRSVSMLRMLEGMVSALFFSQFSVFLKKAYLLNLRRQGSEICLKKETRKKL